MRVPLGVAGLTKGDQVGKRVAASTGQRDDVVTIDPWPGVTTLGASVAVSLGDLLDQVKPRAFSCRRAIGIALDGGNAVLATDERTWSHLVLSVCFRVEGCRSSSSAEPILCFSPPSTFGTPPPASCLDHTLLGYAVGRTRKIVPTLPQDRIVVRGLPQGKQDPRNQL